LTEKRQLAKLGRQPFELIVARLAHGLGQTTIHSIRISHQERLELSQLADFCWQRRELVVADLKARDGGQIKTHLPRVPHVETLQIGQQTELGRKRRELVVEDLKTTCLWSDRARALRQSHREPLERRQVRNLARQRAKLVVGETECLHVLHAKQLQRHLRQIHALKLNEDEMKMKRLNDSR
jgi:hypothetical protein